MLENLKKETVEENHILDRIIFLDNKTKEEIALNVAETGKLDRLYWLQLFLAAVIATLGLLQNSIPVVIGVMLIAPLLRPIQSLSFGIVSAHRARTWKAFKNLFLSILLVVLTSLIITYLIPVRLETTEVLARTNPNILDFFIAGASAAIAFLALVYKEKLSMSIAGVAMAASLLPPLSVIGIEMAYKNYFLAWNSFLLFVTNLVAIVFIGIFLFFIFGFRPHQDDDKEKFKSNLLLLTLAISIISLPLLVSIINLKNEYDKKIFLENKFLEEVQEINLSDISILNKNNANYIKLKGEYYNQNLNSQIIKEKIKKIEDEFSKKYSGKDKIELELNYIKKIQN